ncbi:hypothetical protein M8J76_013891 [Diaphorina citri]|nr:hypothetical protein M8J76_013891 [Diaphorina citri]
MERKANIAEESLEDRDSTCGSQLMSESTISPRNLVSTVGSITSGVPVIPIGTIEDDGIPPGPRYMNDVLPAFKVSLLSVSQVHTSRMTDEQRVVVSR